MRVKLVRDWRQHAAGEVIELPEGMVLIAIAEGAVDDVEWAGVRSAEPKVVEVRTKG